MSLTTGAPKSKRSIRGFLRNTFSRSSSTIPTHIPSSPPDSSQDSPSLGSPNLLHALAHSAGALDVSPSNDERLALHSVSAPSTSSAGQTSFLPIPLINAPTALDVPDPPPPSDKRLAVLRPISAPAVVGAKPTNSQPNSTSMDTSAVLGSARTTSTNMTAVWGRLKASLQGLRDITGVFPHLSLAVGILLECFDELETAARSQRDYEDLAKELTTLSESLTQYIKPPMPMLITQCISGVAMEIEQQAKDIDNKMRRGTAERLMIAKADEEDVIRHYRRIQSLFRQLQASINMGASTWSIANEHLVNTRLEGLNPVKQATYDSTLSSALSRRSCTEGTREEILSNLDKWLSDSSAPAVYWMNGMAGTGKTTIACTFSEQLEHRKLLAASFFCTRTVADCRDTARIIPTIAYQLARYSAPFQASLYEALGDDPDAGSKNIQKQFERLLRDPLLKVKDAMPGKFVIVIDALDECGDRNRVETMLDMLFRYAPDMPLRFFITSRPEPEIYDRMMLDVKARAALHLHDIETSLVQADIELYLKEELGFISPPAAQIAQLAQRSGSLFIYAATLVRYIRFSKRFGNPRQRLQSVLSLTPESTKKHAEIDALYTTILESALEETQMEQQEADDVRLVLRTVLFTQEPVSVETIATLAGLDDPQRVLFALQPLRSVLHQSEDTKLVSTLHASFPDFMFSNERSGVYFCDIVEHSQMIAERCFLAMTEQLRFNICDLESSFVPDEKVKDIQQRIKQRISPALAYACRYWGSHLALASISGHLLKLLEEFIRHQLLFWTEVLSLRREIGTGLEMLLKAKQWLNLNRVESTSSELVVLVEDSYNFVTAFAGSPASQSTPHIYISVLPFCPRSSSVYKNYWKRTQGLLELKGSLMERREAASLATWNIGSRIYSVAYSPDGTRVAVGCDDHSVRILNAHDGTPLFDPLRGHTNTVSSVVFSPDGKLVASASYDASVRLWNAHSGAPIFGALKDDNREVNSVAFSPDSTRVISGSDDNHIRVWSSYTGALLQGPLEGHTGLIRSVAFSHDGALIVSSSNDGTIRLWNARDGTPAAPPFTGHADHVMSVAFIPGEHRFVSGSKDRSVHVWNKPDGLLAPSPFTGHTGYVNFVAVSPDGTRVASGSTDRTVRVCKIDDGTLTAGPFVGHTNSVHSIVYSPDGTRVISGSFDGTIRVWNVRDGLPLPPPAPFKNHMNNLKSVSFSGDGARLLSISSDFSVRAWGISPDIAVVEPLESRSIVSSLQTAPLMGFDAPINVIDYDYQFLNSVDGGLVSGSLEGQTDSFTSSGLSADGTLLVTGFRNGFIRLWDLKKAKQVNGPFCGHGGEIISVALSLDHSRVTSCSNQDKTIRVWNTRNTVLNIFSSDVTQTDSTFAHHNGQFFDGWNIRKDGWVTNGSSQLLFWIPHDFASAHVWPSPHAEFIITKDGMVHILQQKLLLGGQWSRCYTPD
ncbi:unnamed protein product [Rhizoctonia solani]|uniref:Vegetative incompatibility protein HET-E-1 n=1 Tax=Rhizoctonia solani TaxID=456999 RepID=A0A8H3CH14_9AGAM|nr:unnamed protein product [Rhizoctonia solani]